MSARRYTDDSNILGLDFEGLTLVDTSPFNATAANGGYYLPTPYTPSISLKADSEFAYAQHVYVAKHEYTSWANDVEVPCTG